MMIKLKITIFFLCLISALNIKAENKFETLCWNALADMSIYITSYGSSEEINDVEVYRWVDDNYVYQPLKTFLKKKWLPILKSDRDFTLNNVYVMKDKYLSSCVAAVT